MNIKENKYAVNLLIFSFAIFTIYAIIFPFNWAPDEILRFDIVDFIYKYRELPIGGDSRLYYGEFGVTYAFKPYITYIFSAILCIIADTIKINIEPFMVARFFSIVCGVGTIYFTYLISNLIFKDRRVKYIVPIFLASIPQFVFLNSYVNQDSFMILLSAITIYLWIEGEQNNWKWNTVLKIGIVNGILLLTYMNGYSIILCTIIWVLITYKSKDKIFYKKTIVFLLLLFLVAGWFFIRNLIIYNGDIFGKEISLALQEKLAIDRLKPSLRDVPYKHGLNMLTILFKTDWLKQTFLSFWALLGNMNIKVDSFYYYIMIFVSAITILGVIYNFFVDIKKRNFNYLFKIRILFLIEIFIAFILSIWYSTYSDFQPQGRYLYPAIIPIIILIGESIELLFNKFIRFKNVIIITILGIIILNIMLPITSILKNIYFVI